MLYDLCTGITIKKVVIYLAFCVKSSNIAPAFKEKESIGPIAQLVRASDS